MRRSLILLAIAFAGCGDSGDRVQGETSRQALAGALRSLGTAEGGEGCARLTRTAIRELETEFSASSCSAAFAALGRYLRDQPGLQRSLSRADIAPSTDDAWSRPAIRDDARRAWLRVRVTPDFVDGGTVSADVGLRVEDGRWKLEDGVALLLGR